MKKLLLLVMAFAIGGWAVPKPMESIENYNVLMVHGAYGSDKGFEKSTLDYLLNSVIKNYDKELGDSLGKSDVSILSYRDMNHLSLRQKEMVDQLYSKMLYELDSTKRSYNEGYDIPSAYDKKEYLGDATLGGYDSNDRITKWISKNILEEPDIGGERNPTNSYVYNWRSFSNPANSSRNNAHELADRTWNKGNKPFHQGGFGHRRALMEEAQEVKASLRVSKNGTDSLYVGQDALEMIRQNPDLYHQRASRYILVGHSMGGVVSREYVQGNFYNGDVDKIIFKKFCIGA